MLHDDLPLVADFRAGHRIAAFVDDLTALVVHREGVFAVRNPGRADDPVLLASRLELRGGRGVQNAGCLITYLAEWNAEADGWIVVDISYPGRLVC